MDSERSVLTTTRVEASAWPVSWSGLWVGMLAALATGLVIGLVGTALGAHQIAAGRTNRPGLLMIVFSVGGAFFANAVGGWVAAAVAGIRRSETGMLHGAIVWLLGVPVLLVLGGLGTTGYLGAWYSVFGPASAADAVAARNAALGGVTALMIGLVGSVIGGWMGSGEPMTFRVARRDEFEARRRRAA